MKGHVLGEPDRKGAWSRHKIDGDKLAACGVWQRTSLTRLRRANKRDVTETDLASLSGSTRSKTKERTIRGREATPTKDHDWKCRDERHGVLQQSSKWACRVCRLWLSALGVFDQTSQERPRNNMFRCSMSFDTDRPCLSFFLLLRHT